MSDDTGYDEEEPRERELGLCPHCGTKLVEYTFTFSRLLRFFLRRLYDAGGGPMRTLDLGRGLPNGPVNSQKLRYWGLAEQAGRGYWKITQQGRDFMEGKAFIASHVVMYRNTFVRWEGEPITIASDLPENPHYEEYAEQVRSQLHER